MYNTSQNYKNYIKEPSRMFESKIILADRTFTNDDIIQLKTELQQPENGFSIGKCISKSLELTLKNDGGTYASVGVLDVSIGLKMGELIEYIPQGVFNIDTVEKTDYTVKITAYDNMIKFETAYSEKYDNPTIKQVIDQLQEITGVEFDSSVTIPSYTLSKLSGYTCREILGYVASIMGGNAYITRDGKFTVVSPVEVDYSVTADNYWDYEIEDNTYKIGMLTCQNKVSSDAVDESDDYEAVEEKNTISVGELGTDSMELTFVNPWMTETILNTVYNKLKDFSFLGYSMKWQGDLSLDVGNIINVTDKHRVTRKALVFSDKLTYNGGLTQQTSAKGQTKSSNEFNTVDSPTELDRISVKVLLAEKAIIQKANISDLTAVSAKVGNLQASIATINTALINYAKIDDLNATNANVSNLNAQYANLSNAIINKADIADLNAVNANISNLQATVADINTLVSGNLTSANINSLVLTADKVTVQNGFIKNAMIESLAADKITAGTLSTNKLTIASNDGGLVMSNNTIQFSDKDENVRVQIGQDATGDFNFIVKGEDGRTVLLDSNGLHEGAISDGLIKTDMIADNSINSNKIDYSSVISGLNSDGSNYINASKITIDLTGQTLDLAFNSIKKSVDDLQNTTSTTAIQVMQGKIETLISNTTVIVDGEEKTFKDVYNATVQTVNSLSTTIGEHTSTLNALNGTVSSNTSKITSIQADLNGVRTSVSSVQSELNSTKSQLSSLSSTLDGFESRVEATESTLSTHTEQLETVDSRINAKVAEIKATTDSISQSVSNINSSITTINNTLGNKAEKSTVESISNSVASLNTSLSGITGRISSLETNTTALTTTLNNLSVGGRNLALKTGDAYIKTGTGVTNNWSKMYSLSENHRLSKGSLVTISFDINVTNASGTYRIQFSNDGDVGGIWDSFFSDTNFTEGTTHITETISLSGTPVASKGINIRMDNSTSTVTISNLKLEAGNKATNWTPAPEDIDSEITTVKETVASNTSEISALKSSISLKVDSSELTTYKETVNGQMNTINSSISSMQASIDLNTSAITSKVSRNDVGTIITQSPTSVMTAFNKISNYFEVSSSGAKFGNIATGDYMAFNAKGLVRYIANQEKRYIYMVQPREFKKTLNNQTPALTSAQSSVGKTNNWDNINNNMPKAKNYAQTFTLTFDNELINLLAGYAPQYGVKLSGGVGRPSNLSYSGLSSNGKGEDYLTDSYLEIVSMTSTSITFKAATICCVYEVTTDKTGLIKYYQFKRNYAGGGMTWNGLIFA